jgi:diaminopimelate decarboxylase
MQRKPFPFSNGKLEAIVEEHPTPFHIYDERAIRENAQELLRAFAWAPDFKEFFAVKATPNPYIIKILQDEGFGADCSSLPELMLAERVGLAGEDIMFSSNDTPADEFVYARKLGAIVNLDDITHIEFLQRHAGLPDLVCCRYNPGASRKGNTIIGEPEQAKYGFTKKQILDGYRILKEKGVERFGLHTMVVSNELNPDTFVETAVMLFELVGEIADRVGVRIEFVNLGGGIGIPYRPDEKRVDLRRVSDGIRASYESAIATKGLSPLKVYMECGRMVTGPYGYLVTRVLHKKETYKNYLGLDASMANLMRPAFYGAYHHVTVVGKEEEPATQMYDITGSLCENNDKFAIDRPLPETDVGDIVVIHDTGAHGHSMGFNYNGKLRSAELLLKPDGRIEAIRRAEEVEDYFATLDFSRL